MMKTPRIGKLLKLWRATQEVEQHKLAAEIGMQPSTLCRLEAGKSVDMPTTIKVIAWMFGDIS
jgi:transcriptional regulator with XRE-family HTH domain